MAKNGRSLRDTIDGSERVGIIGSPSSTAELTLDVLGTAASRKLVGEFALFQYTQDASRHYALGQITEVELKNIWHEDPTMRSLIRQRGPVDAVSERQDTHVGQMTLSAVFEEESDGSYSPSILGTVPSTGTPVQLASDEVLNQLLDQYSDLLFYLGNVYGSTPQLPLWFKHFDQGRGGAGEAYHLGIFGKTGSGKSVLAKKILTAYSQHPSMGLLVIDPQGEFARDIESGGEYGGFPLPLKDLLTGMGRHVEVVNIHNIVLDRWALFEEVLYESFFFEELSVPKGDNRSIACEVLADQLQGNVTLADLHKRESFERAWATLTDSSKQKVIYKSSDARERFDDRLHDANPDDIYEKYWAKATRLFREDRPDAVSVGSVLYRLLSRNGSSSARPVYVIDLSGEDADDILWNDTVQALVIKRILNGLRWRAEDQYEEGKSLNTLVLIDEAHRLAPKRARDNEAAAEVRSVLVDSARTTRKYGLGWAFISQTLSSLHEEIVQQLRIYFFGFGLSMGREFNKLKDLAGGSGRALDLYRSFRDPHSSFDVESREYSFMTIGPVSPLSFSGTPLFFNAFNEVGEFLRANDLQDYVE